MPENTRSEWGQALYIYAFLSSSRGQKSERRWAPRYRYRRGGYRRSGCSSSGCSRWHLCQDKCIKCLSLFSFLVPIFFQDKCIKCLSPFSFGQGNWIWMTIFPPGRTQLPGRKQWIRKNYHSLMRWRGSISKKRSKKRIGVSAGNRGQPLFWDWTEAPWEERWESWGLGADFELHWSHGSRWCIKGKTCPQVYRRKETSEMLIAPNNLWVSLEFYKWILAATLFSTPFAFLLLLWCMDNQEKT